MEPKRFRLRLFALGSVLLLCLCFYVVALYDAQIVHGQDYLDQSKRSNTSVETVRASRGILTDRNGKILVSNRLVYTLSFDPALSSEETLNEDLLRLTALFSAHGLSWSDELPISAEAPYTYLENAAAPLCAYLKTLGWTELLPEEEGGTPLLAPEELLARLAAEYGAEDGLSPEEVRALAGLRYTLARGDGMAYTLLNDVDTALISEVKDGGFRGARVGNSTVRVYETECAAHILGRVTKIPSEQWADYKEKGYAMNDLVGRDGVEYAFEDDLRGTDGTRIISMNEEGKVTGELYSVAPENGSTVALTLDIDLQEQVEKILAERVEEMTAEDGIARGAAAAVVQVGTGEALALASYPSYSLANFSEEYATLSNDPSRPYWNRATRGLYAPGSTFKPLTAIAALETGVIEPDTYITTHGQYTYYDLRLNCWIYSSRGATHGTINVTQAIKESCNYFFYDVGRMTGISALARYASAFGLGERTGIEIPEETGAMTTPDYVNSLEGQYWTDGQTLTAAIGQSYNLFTPVQLANYIATLAGGGTRHPVHLLKSVTDSATHSLVRTYDEPAAETIPIEKENLRAVLSGMRDLVRSGSVASYFTDCVVDAAAKTGTAQTGSTVSNGVFVCYAPYDNPQIAVAIVIEKGGSGGALASAAVQILNAYFSSADAETVGENMLLK